MYGYLVILTVAPKTVHKHSITTHKTTQIHRSAIFGQDWDWCFQKTNLSFPTHQSALTTDQLIILFVNHALTSYYNGSLQ